MDTWSDPSPYGSDLAAITLSPTLETNEINGLPVVQFDGTNQQLQGAFGFTLAQPTIVALVYRWDSDPTVGTFMIHDGDDATNRNTMYFRAASASMVLFAGSVVATPDGDDLVAHQATNRFDGAASLQRLDGSETIVSAGANALDGLTLGGQFDQGLDAAVSVAEVLVADGANWGATQYAALEAHWSGKYGV